MITVKLTGDWDGARRILQANARDVREALRVAVRQEAEDCRSAIVEGIISQAPGGKKFAPLAQSTLAFRRAAAAGKAIAKGQQREAGINARAAVKATERSRAKMMANARAVMAGSNRALATAARAAARADSRAAASTAKQISRSQMKTSWQAIAAGHKATAGAKILIQSADLMNSIRAIHRGDTSVIGVMRSAKSKDGKSLANIARIHEFGAGPKAVRMTQKQRAFLMAMYRRIGTLKVARGGGGVRIVRIPARPFVRPIFEQRFGDHAAVGRRIAGRLSSLLPALTPK